MVAWREKSKTKATGDSKLCEGIMGVSVIITHSVHLSQVRLCYYMLQLVHRVKLKYLLILYQSIRSNDCTVMPFACTKCDTINIPRETCQDITMTYITLFFYFYCAYQMINYFMYIGIKQYSLHNTNVMLRDYKTHRLLIIKYLMPIHTECHDRRGKGSVMPFACTICDFDIVAKINEILNDFMVVKCTRWDMWSNDIVSNDV